MSVYFLHLHDGDDVLLDEEGQQLADMDMVVATALREARAIIGAEARSGTIMLDKYIVVADENGAVIHELTFANAVTILGR